MGLEQRQIPARAEQQEARLDDKRDSVHRDSKGCMSENEDHDSVTSRDTFHQAEHTSRAAPELIRKKKHKKAQ